MENRNDLQPFSLDLLHGSELSFGIHLKAHPAFSGIPDRQNDFHHPIFSPQKAACFERRFKIDVALHRKHMSAFECKQMITHAYPRSKNAATQNTTSAITA